MKKPRILLFDIETLPNIGYTWGKWDQNVLSFLKEWELASFAYKWLGEKEVFCETRKGEKEDKRLAKKLWSVLDQADVVVAHNGDAFDNKKANARFLKFGLRPPSPYQTVDTKKVAKAHFNFNSNSLDDLGNYLGVGRKLKHTGFDLWLGCLAGKAESWRLMERYNKQDVRLLEKVYLKLRPWAKSGPNLAQLASLPNGCPACGGTKLKSEGLRFTKGAAYRRYQCLDCGHWAKGRTAEPLPKPKIVNL